MKPRSTLLPSQCIPIFRVLAGSAVMAIGLMVALAEGPEASPKTKPLSVAVIAKETGAPIASARVSLREAEGERGEKETDANGVAVLDVTVEKFEYASIRVEFDGHVPMTIAWRSSEGQTPPEAITIPLEKGTVIGGTVKDSEGQPVSDVKVLLLVPVDDKTGVYPSIWDYQVKTDEAGKWSCDVMPADLGDVWIKLSHPDYVSDSTYGQTAKHSIDELRAQTAVAVMQKGLSLRGRIVDSNGKPIQSARVSQGSDRFGTDYPSADSDQDGYFEFPCTPPGKTILTVSAMDHSPELLEVEVSEGMKDLLITLGPGKTIKGRVTDTKGMPLKDVMIAADTWRGSRSLDLETRTDAEGRFIINHAPSDAVLFDILHKGYMSVRNRSLQASDTEYEIILPPLLSVSGTVTDADTGKPVPEFRVITGIQFGEEGGRRSWQPGEAIIGKEGAFSKQFSYPYPAHLLKVEAEGYMPEISRPIKSDEGDVNLAFALHKGTGISGTVTDAANKPVSDATVCMLTAGSSPQFRDGRFIDMSDVVYRKTGEKGAFSFPPQTEDYLLAVESDSGWAEVERASFEKSPVIALVPWARIEGDVRIGSKPAANATVSLWFERVYDPSKPMLSLTYSSKSDESGHFVVERVVPGVVRIGRQVPVGERSWSTTCVIALDVKPGETTKVTIGGSGRPVIGKVAAPESYTKPIDWPIGNSTLMTQPVKPTLPENWKSLSDEERRAWYTEWQKSPEFVDSRIKQRSFAVQYQPDGSFRIDDVTSGTYQLNCNFAEEPDGKQFGRGETIGTLSKEVTIPEMEGGRSDEPLDLGTLEVTIVTTLEVGKPVPALETVTLDGKPLKLADFKGKFVLLDFWATWCGPCRAELPHVKSAYEKFGKQDNFVMIGLSLDEDTKEPIAYCKENGCEWIQGFLGEWKKTDIPSQFGVRGIPSTFLIGPDGNLVAKNMRGESIVQAIESALGQAK